MGDESPCEIVPGLYLGGIASMDHIIRLKISSIFRFMSFPVLWNVPNDCEVKSWDICDEVSQNVSDIMDQVTMGIHSVLQQKKRVLVHCQGRIILMICSWYISFLYHGDCLSDKVPWYDFERCIPFDFYGNNNRYMTFKARPIIRPNYGFTKQLLDWEAKHCSHQTERLPLFWYSDSYYNWFECKLLLTYLQITTL